MSKVQVCRVCLSTAINKDVSQLKLPHNMQYKSCSEIFEFCLSIQVAENRKLCTKCFKKIISFYKFKSLALKNDCFFRTLATDSYVKLEVLETEDIYQLVKSDDENIYEGIGGTGLELENIDEVKVYTEAEIKEENDSQGYDSDDGPLSAIKSIKSEDSSSMLNGTADKKPRRKKKLISVLPKKRGRKKGLKRDPNIKQVCGKCGKAVKDLKEHMERHLPMEDRKKVPCKICDKVFVSYGARYRHHKTKHLGIRTKCEICSIEVINIKAHMLVKHNRDALKYVCVVCDERFINPSSLDGHMLKHTKARPFECNECGKAYRTKIVLVHHQRQVHLKEKSHLCQFCSKTFFKKYQLQIHLRHHTKERPYKCDECGGSFTSCTTLKNHKLTHSDVKNFHCQLCSMSFVNPNYLRAHMVSHTKERKYPCKYCGVGFGRSDHRKRHQFTAHEKHHPQPSTMTKDQDVLGDN